MTSGTAVKGQVKGQMKGLLKGLRYISQIFDEEEEKEIQIGFPTDVKHLAHIGAENAQAAAPSWMTEFKEAADQSSSGTVNPAKTPEENNNDGSSKGEGKKNPIRKIRPRSTENQSTMSSPSRESSTEGTKPGRRHHSSETSRRTSRHSSEDEKPPTTTKHRRKSKTSSEDKEGSSRRASEDKEGSSRRAPRSRRPSKGDSLTDFSFTDSASASGPGPGPQ